MPLAGYCSVTGGKAVLKSFVAIHLEEEIHREALVKDWGAKRLQYLGNGQMYHFRTKDRAEIDFIVKIENKIIPIEVKWNSNPLIKDVPHLVSFIRENPLIKTGYVVCRIRICFIYLT